MKLILSIVQDVDADNLIEEIMGKGYRVTVMSSTGGFLKSGNTTMFSGVKDKDVSDYLEIVRNNCKTREVTRTFQAAGMPGQVYTGLMSVPIQVKVGGATVFVLNLEDFKSF